MNKHLTGGHLSETAIQRRIVRWARDVHKLTLHATMGHHLRTVQQRQNGKAEGYLKGVPDLLFFTPHPTGAFHGLALELKTETGTPTPEQIQVNSMLRDCGWDAQIVYGEEEAMEAIVAYYHLNEGK